MPNLGLFPMVELFVTNSTERKNCDGREIKRNNVETKKGIIMDETWVMI